MTAGTTRRHSASPLWAFAIAWPVCAGVYLLFADSTGIRELVAAAVAASFSAVAVAVARLAACADLRFRLRLRDVLQAWRMPWYLISGTGEVLRALGQQLFTRDGAASVLATVPFDVGDRDDPAEAGRRALAVFDTTATPNFVVLGLIDEQGTMLYHQVLPGDVLKMTKRLGARP